MEEFEISIFTTIEELRKQGEINKGYRLNIGLYLQKLEEKRDAELYFVEKYRHEQKVMRAKPTCIAFTDKTTGFICNIIKREYSTLFYGATIYIYAYVSIPQILIKKLKNKDTLKKHIKERIHLFRGLSIDRIYLKNNEYRIGFKYKLFLTILDGQAKRGIYSKYAEKEVRKKCIELAKLLKEKMNVVDKL